VAKVIGSIYKQLITPEPIGRKRLRVDSYPETDSQQAVLDQSLRIPLYSLLQRLQCAYLVVDDLDRCGDQAYHLLYQELSQLQRHGLRILTTSRFSSKEEPTLRFWCDHCSPDGPEVGKPHIWEVDVQVCKMCFDEAEDDDERNGACAVCGDCRKLGKICNKERYVVGQYLKR
jgi:hypothetical protein